MELYLEKDKVNVKEFIDKYLKDINDDLKKNPQFEWSLEQAIRFLTRSYEAKKVNLPPFNLKISQDGKTFEITSGIRRSPDCLNDRLQDNKNYDCVKFHLDDHGIMEILTMNGTFFRFDNFVREIKDDNLRNRFSISNSKVTPTVIQTYHRHSTFLASGIEVEASTFSDQYPLSCSFDDIEELKRETIIHSPRSWPFNLLPEMPRYIFAPTVTNAHRFIDQLGVINMRTASKVGQTEVSDFRKYQAGLEFPEFIQTGPIPILEFKDGKMVVSELAEEWFRGMTPYEIEKELNIHFYQGIETSKTRELKPELAETLQEIALKGLESKYHLSEEDVKGTAK